MAPNNHQKVVVSISLEALKFSNIFDLKNTAAEKSVVSSVDPENLSGSFVPECENQNDNLETNQNQDLEANQNHDQEVNQNNGEQQVQNLEIPRDELDLSLFFNVPPILSPIRHLNEAEEFLLSLPDDLLCQNVPAPLSPIKDLDKAEEFILSSQDGMLAPIEEIPKAKAVSYDREHLIYTKWFDDHMKHIRSKFSTNIRKKRILASNPTKLGFRRNQNVTQRTKR